MPQAGTGKRSAAVMKKSASDAIAAARIAQIIAAIRSIPCGRVMSYGQVAAAAGLPGCARLVARVLAQSADLQLPWQRVIRADGSLAVRTQKQRLLREGVQFNGEKVSASAWMLAREASMQSSLDALLWRVR
jgi:methylated-DNA-protein-cysteine methyltransferase related protein